MTGDVCAEVAAALPAEFGPWALLAVFGGQLVEYVFPPAPGEVATVLGVFLAVQGGGSLGGVLTAALVGSVLGAGAAWWLGGRALRGARWESLAPLVARFERHGAAYLLVNRFLPGIRPLLFVAAGAAGMRVAPVMLYATLSALAWNTLLVIAGWAAAGSWPRLCGWFFTYSRGALIVVGVACTLSLTTWTWRRAR